jgi:hypothetical protein
MKKLIYTLLIAVGACFFSPSPANATETRPAQTHLIKAKVHKAHKAKAHKAAKKHQKHHSKKQK